MSSQSEIAHMIKHRKYANNEFYTPVSLVKELLSKTPFRTGQTILDSAYGTGNFYNNFPTDTINSFTKDFFNENGKYDWVVTNPPYSELDDWIEHTCFVSNKGFALLIALHNLTPRRIELVEKNGWGITKIILCKVFRWYGISAYIICEKDKKSIVEYNRKVWYEEAGR